MSERIESRRIAHASITIVDRSLAVSSREQRCQSGCELRPRSSPLLAGVTVCVHASTRGNRAFTSMDRGRKENDLHSKPTLHGNKRLLGNLSFGRKKINKE